MNRVTRARLISTFAVAAGLAAPPARAQSAPSAIESYFGNWFDRVDRAQKAQPRWITPRLEEEFRYDQYWETLPHGGGSIDSFGAGKGLELIPTEQTEIILGVPPYMERNGKIAHDGLGDMPFLVKLRLLTGNETGGDYIVTAFLQGSAPMGDKAFSSHHYAIGPTLAL